MVCATCRSKKVCTRGPAEEFPHRERLMLGSRRAILLMVGSLPSRAVATMSLCGNTSPPLITLINCLQLLSNFKKNQLRHESSFFLQHTIISFFHHMPPQAGLGRNKVPFAFAHGTLVACPPVSIYHPTSYFFSPLFLRNAR